MMAAMSLSSGAAALAAAEAVDLASLDAAAHARASRDLTRHARTREREREMTRAHAKEGVTRCGAISKWSCVASRAFLLL